MLRKLVLTFALACLGGCGPGEGATLVDGQRYIDHLVASDDLIAFTDGVEASTRTDDEGLILKVVDRLGRQKLSVSVDVGSERRAVRALALGRAAVASLESTLARGVLRMHPLDGSGAIEPSQQGWAMGVSTADDGFVWVEAALAELRDEDGDGMAEMGVSQLALVEADELGTNRSRRPIATDAPIVEPVSRLLPFPVPAGFAVQGRRALFAWDASGVCGGRATAYVIDLDAATAQVIWRGRAAATDDGCRCLSVAGNVADAVDDVAFDRWTPVIVGRALPCGAVTGGASFTVRGERTWQNADWVHGVASGAAGVYAVAGNGVSLLDDEAGFVPHLTISPRAPAGDGPIDTSCHGVAVADDCLVVADRTSLQVVRGASSR